MRIITLIICLFTAFSSLYSAIQDHYPRAIYLLLWCVILYASSKEDDKK